MHRGHSTCETRSTWALNLSEDLDPSGNIKTPFLLGIRFLDNFAPRYEPAKRACHITPVLHAEARHKRERVRSNALVKNRLNSRSDLRDVNRPLLWPVGDPESTANVDELENDTKLPVDCGDGVDQYCHSLLLHNTRNGRERAIASPSTSIKRLRALTQ
jgi:hypothetical protein